MTNEATPVASAKDTVIAWVRSKNPASMELKRGCRVSNKDFDANWTISYADNDCVVYCNDEHDNDYHWDKMDHYNDGKFEILGSDMHLPELLIALNSMGENRKGLFSVDDCGNLFYIAWQSAEAKSLGDIRFDLTKNLHNQAPEFYEALLPLLPSQ